ncbi:MAG: M23 family metallopeptidase [Clostridia bacterium]|nr:M23 family metallopeptidase [Clostridia bacterium]
MKKNQQTESGVKVRKKAWLYSILSASVVLLAAIIVLIVLAVNGIFGGNPTLDNNNPPTGNGSGDNSGGNSDGTGSGSGNNSGDNSGGDVNAGTTVSFVNPLESMTVITEQGFFYNSTLNCYYEHVGIDVSADAGSDVFAVCNGTVESIYTGDVLHGTQIVLLKDDGTKVVYGYVDPVETLKAGDTVAQGQVIAKVAEPTGNEYKSGAHLHLEMYVGGEIVDPAGYLTLSEK